MKAEYTVQIEDFRELKEMPARWQPQDFRNILRQLEFDDVDEIEEAELRDMCLMSLQDLEPADAAAALLQYVLGEQLNEGQISNMANEMEDEKLWEEHADPALHEELFNIGSLLYEASPGRFPKPDAVHLSISITAVNKAAGECLQAPLRESFLVRLLADGMDNHATLHRLFGEQIAGASFPEADRIVWTVQSEPSQGGALVVNIVSSGYWLDALKETRSFTSHAEADEE